MDTLKAYKKLEKIPFGKAIASFLVCMRIPYFFSIKPRIIEINEGGTIVEMKERRRVHNHLKTIHAIALCNLCELSMALTTEVTIPKNLRFIPSGMTVSYKKKAKGTMRAISQANKNDFKVGNVDINIDVFDEKNINVMSATITLNIKEK
jgi:acyl-coenzyme A thioesterase PaaI-like protein